MTPPNPLQQLYELEKSSPRFHHQLGNLIHGKEYQQCVSHLQGEDLVRLVEYLDSVLDCFDPAVHAFRTSMRELRRICGAHGTLPKSCMLPGPFDIGPSVAFGLVQEGSLNGSKVRVKCVRVYSGEDLQRVKKTFNQSAVVWKRLDHPNIIPILGVTVGPLRLVSDWIPCGDLTGYIVNNQDANRFGLASVPPVLSDVAEGLNYLHSSNVIHGGLKGPNILMDINGRARITDYGLTAVTRDLKILDEWGTYSKEGDVFSLAMVTIEIFTGAIPFKDSLPTAAMLAILEGKRPPRPTHPTFTDGLWVLTQRCWDQEAHLRPQVSEVLQVLRDLGIPAWKRLIHRPRATDQSISLITTIFSNSNEIEVVQRFCGDDAQTLVDMIDEAWDSLQPSLQRKCLSTLRKICGRQALLPRSLQIPLRYSRLDNPLYQGGCADVWKGEHQGRRVAVKVLRVYAISNFDEITKVLQGGCYMEDSLPSKRATIVGSVNGVGN
ncbi:kinase-like protein [Thelephora ganbajun]|uniref:Kinase-like protein n=1 Tax=Thelephora ganbajun TaxID=370292 RepID=A0ACB6ZBN8_THEGA|nr:kinase-like protein [Thelephora ganbajun]